MEYQRPHSSQEACTASTIGTGLVIPAVNTNVVKYGLTYLQNCVTQFNVCNCLHFGRTSVVYLG